MPVLQNNPKFESSRASDRVYTYDLRNRDFRKKPPIGVFENNQSKIRHSEKSQSTETTVRRVYDLTESRTRDEYRARYYSTELGQFISRDPLEYVDGMNIYSGYFARGFANDPSGEISTIGSSDITEEYNIVTPNAKGEYKNSHGHLADFKHASYGGTISVSKAWLNGCGWEIEVESQGGTITFYGPKHTINKSGSGRGGSKSTLKYISTWQHEWIHALHWINLYNNEYVPLVKKYENNLYASEADARLVEKIIIAKFLVIAMKFNLQANELHKNLDQLNANHFTTRNLANVEKELQQALSKEPKATGTK